MQNVANNTINKHKNAINKYIFDSTKAVTVASCVLESILLVSNPNQANIVAINTPQLSCLYMVAIYTLLIKCRMK